MNVALNGSKRVYESQLIVACARTSILLDQTAQIAYILTQKLDWEYILKVAGRNGVLPLISTVLLARFREHLPAAIEDQIYKFLQQHTKTNLILTAKLIEIKKLLDKTDIPILPIKGPSLAIQAYGNLAHRHFIDLDILVKPKHFDSAVAVLAENGYRPTSRASWFRRKALFFTHKKDVVLASPDDMVFIELHWKLSGSHFSMPFEISLLWHRLETLKLGGTNLSALPFKDLFVYLCLHGSRHEWERLAWICDLHELIRSVESSGIKVDWNEIHEHAKDHGCERVLELGLFLVDEFFDSRTDFSEYEKIEANPSLKEIVKQVRVRIFSPTRIPSLKKAKYMYLLSLQERRTHRIKLYLVYLTYYAKLLLTPNSLDKTIFHLPGIFYPLYFILRPIRLVLTYFGPRFIDKSAE